MKVASSCSSNWRKATDAEVCAFITGGGGYTSAKLSSGKVVTACTSITNMAPSGSGCVEYHPATSGYCSFYECLPAYYICTYIPDGPCGSYCPCARGMSGCPGYERCQCYVTPGGGGYYCVEYVPGEPAYTSYHSAIAYNCMIFYSSGFASGICVKN